MAHELEMQANGQASMFFVGEKPWHGLGTEFKDAPSIKDAIAAAGLDWQVQTRPLYLSTEDGLLGSTAPAKACVRSTDGKILGVVGEKYTPLQNAEAFDFFQPFLDAGEAMLNTAGSLREGSRVWVLAKLNREAVRIVGDDLVEKFVMLSNSHDGKTSVRVGFCPVRIVCANTLAMAESSGESKLLRIRHHKKVATDLEEVRKIMNLANQQFEATAEEYRFLATRQINHKDLEKYVRKVFSLKAKVAEENDGTVTDAELEAESPRVLNKIIPLFEGGRGAQMAGVKGTLWAAYNSVSEYLSWGAARNKDNRLNNLWFGSGGDLNKRALETAVEMAKAMA